MRDVKLSSGAVIQVRELTRKDRLALRDKGLNILSTDHIYLTHECMDDVLTLGVVGDIDSITVAEELKVFTAILEYTFGVPETDVKN